MFCPKCGKTLPFDAVECEYCGMPVGESRFEGSPYTSAQAHIQPGDNVRELLSRGYVRSAYSGASRAAAAAENAAAAYTAAEILDEPDVDDRTSYRPTYDAAGLSGSARVEPEEDGFGAEQPVDDMPEAGDSFADFGAAPEQSAEEAAVPAEDDGDELSLGELDMSRFRARPIESAGQVGISADVTERMQAIESEQPRRVRGFGRRRPVYDDFIQEEETQNYAAEETVQESAQPVDEEQSEVFDDIDEEEFEEVRNSEFGFKQILKVVIGVVIVAALVVGGVLWMNYIRDNQSATPIENVRETLYTDGVALIENHASTANVEKVITDYSVSSDLSALQSQLTAFASTVSALSPEDATENEQVFVQALQKIESNITNCIISDAISVGSNDANAAAASDDRWKVVNNSIAMLKAATSTAELTAIINGEVIDVQQQAEVTPTPEPAVNYNTLSKGDKSDEVVEMQTRLYELGYLSESPDGAFGGKTQTAVKIFQQVSGLPVTGIADNATLTALYADDAPSANLAN